VGLGRYLTQRKATKLWQTNALTPVCLRDLDQAITFYEALGFTRTSRQLKPNPYAVVRREEIQIHLFGMPNFNPADSYGSVIIVVPDPDALYQAFAAGLRAAYKKLPTVGIPRILRPRKKFGTVRGFSVVDVGGNWLRISKLGDAHGDEAKALKTLENGLKRFPDAPVLDYARALLYRAELAVRLHDQDLAQSSLSRVLALELGEEARAMLADELAQTSELVLGG